MTNAQMAHYDLMNLVGRALFGKPSRMTLGMHACMLEGKRISSVSYLADCRKRHWPQTASVTADARRFEELGMLTRLPRAPHTNLIEWEVNRHSLWLVFLHLCTYSVIESIQPSTPPITRDMVEKMLELERSLRPDV